MSNVTGLIDRMEQRGYVERVRVPDDRRVIMIRVTPQGTAMLDEIETLRSDLFRRVLDNLPADRLDGLRMAAADLRAAVETYAADPGVSVHDHAPTRADRRRADTSDRRAPRTHRPEDLTPHGELSHQRRGRRRSPRTPPWASATEPSSRSSSRSCSRSSWAPSTRPSSGVALPTIATELGGNELYNWAVTIYLLTSHDHRPVLRASCPTCTAASRCS